MKMPAMLWLGLASAVPLAAIVLFQNRLVYFPARAAVADRASGQLRAWPPKEDFRGLVIEPAGAARAIAVVFHGNAGHARHREFYATALTPLGLRMVLAEYPGYGPRGGEVSKRSLVDAERTIALAHRLHGSPVLVIGDLLGAGALRRGAVELRERAIGRISLGLGLFIVREITRAHGRQVNVACEGGQMGFTLTLPGGTHGSRAPS